jgi:8-oxo-dGTP diphosphatase
MINKSALLLFKTIGDTRYLMMVRESTKEFLLLPGGKQEADETIKQALRREIKEELSCNVTNVRFLEAVTGVTPDGKPLTISLFTGKLDGTPKPASEIEEIVWISHKDIAKFDKILTPITLAEIFPYLARHNMF